MYGLQCSVNCLVINDSYNSEFYFFFDSTVLLRIAQGVCFGFGYKTQRKGCGLEEGNVMCEL